MQTLITADSVVTVDPQRRVLSPGALLVRNDRIADVAPPAEVTARHPDVDVHVDGHW